MWLYAADNSKPRRDKRVANAAVRQPLWFLLCLRPKTSNEIKANCFSSVKMRPCLKVCLMDCIEITN